MQSTVQMATPQSPTHQNSDTPVSPAVRRFLAEANAATDNRTAAQKLRDRSLRCYHGSDWCQQGPTPHYPCSSHPIGVTAPGHSRSQSVLEVTIEDDHEGGGPLLVLSATGGDCTYVTVQQVQELADALVEHAHTLLALAGRFEQLGGAQ